jgi:predicted ABC-type sugar transport system permease subunit
VLSYYLQPQLPFLDLFIPVADGLLPGLILLIKVLGFGRPFIVVNFKLMYATISGHDLTNQGILHHAIDMNKIICIFASIK